MTVTDLPSPICPPICPDLPDSCIRAVAHHELAISFMSRAELLLWPFVNQWGAPRRAALLRHLNLYTTLYAEREHVCGGHQVSLQLLISLATVHPHEACASDPQRDLEDRMAQAGRSESNRRTF